MSRKKETIRVSILLVIILSGFVIIKPDKVESATEPFFTLRAITFSGGIRPDVLFFLKQHCARIGINIQIYTFPYNIFISELIRNQQFDWDISYVGWTAGEGDPDWSEVYGEKGSLNVAGYDTSMDWDEELGTGRNEWYLQNGISIMPPESEERVQHYWDWEQYLMSELLPCQPTFIPKELMATWSNLQGYDYEEGLQTSWGKMGFTGLHTGQNNPNELVVSGKDWFNLNPIFDTGINYDIVNKIMDRIYMYDSDLIHYPHLATDITSINDTHIRIKIREGVKWHTDPDGIYTNEYLDVDDFYFSLYSYKYLSDTSNLYFWLKDMVKVDQYTLDIFIDRNTSTPENEPYAPFQKFLRVHILPEHYLNQTQLFDGQTPDIYHSSWNRFSSEAFGTGLFELESHIDGVQTILSVVNDCWYLDTTVNKTDMDFENRFGDYSGGLNKLKVRAITNKIAEISEFERGKVDMCIISSYFDKRDEYLQDSDFNVYSNFFDILGYNMRENRDHIGSRDPCPGDSDMTVGLAIRKAISYALDRQEINEVLYGGEYVITNYPIYEGMGRWRNPNIIRYEHNLDTARELMVKANYSRDTNMPDSFNGWEIAGLVLTSVFIAGVIVFTFFKTKKV